jgi:hypothetical protein
LDSGRFETLELDQQSGELRVTLAAADAWTPFARLRIENPSRADGEGMYKPSRQFVVERGAFVIQLGSAAITLDLLPE